MKRREEKRRPTLFDFVESKQEQKAEKKDVSDELYTFIKSRGRVTKDEVLKWAKSRGVATADLLKAVEKLVANKKIRKRLDEDGNLVYECVG